MAGAKITNMITTITSDTPYPISTLVPVFVLLITNSRGIHRIQVDTAIVGIPIMVDRSWRIIPMFWYMMDLQEKDPLCKWNLLRTVLVTDLSQSNNEM